MQSKKMFTPHDDEELVHLVNTFGDDNWITIAHQMSRPFTTRQCRDRWRNYLDPKIDRALWAVADDANLLEAYQRFPNRWATIAGLFPGRTCNFLRNRCLVLLRKVNKKDPEVRAHAPLRAPSSEHERFSFANAPRLLSDEEDIIDVFLGRRIRLPSAAEREARVRDGSERTNDEC
jgi:myb proto-oncogene protein